MAVGKNIYQRLDLPKEHLSHYRISLILSTASVVFGVAREFIIISLLGLTAVNDQLQIYLTIFYSISLSSDAVRLAGLNLFDILPLWKIISYIGLFFLPLTMLIGFLTNYFAGNLNKTLLLLSILGSFLNLLVLLVITYKQRYGAFLAAQIINVFPNFVLIPGVIALFFFNEKNSVFYIVSLCCLVPVLQLMMLGCVRLKEKPQLENTSMGAFKIMALLLRHSTAIFGEQLFQVFIRTAFLKVGHGYLALYAIAVRTYAAARFILIDSLIGAKLASWKKALANNEEKLLVKAKLEVFLFVVSLFALPVFKHSLLYFGGQIGIILLCGFYFAALVRMIYFKINRFEHDSRLVIRFGAYETIFAVVTYGLFRQFSWPAMILIWMWYVLKPVCQLSLLRPKLYHLDREVIV